MSMENLDPLRQKPDTELTGEQKQNSIKEFTEFTCQHILTFFKMMDLKTHIDCQLYNEPTDERFIFRFYKVDAGYESAPESFAKAILKAESRIRELEEELNDKAKTCADLTVLLSEEKVKVHEANDDRDKFAIGFGNWIANEAVLGDSSYHKHAFGYGELKTMPELLELYKESLLNQKP